MFLLPALPPPTKKQKTHTTEVTRKTMGAAGHCLYHQLWSYGIGSNQWRTLIGSWVMLPLTGSIKIGRGGEKT
jgi:hypothetical protein